MEKLLDEIPMNEMFLNEISIPANGTKNQC